MIESSYPPGSIGRYCTSEIAPRFKKNAIAALAATIGIVAITVIGHFSLKLIVGGLPADSLGERVAFSVVDFLWGIVTVGVVALAIALIVMTPLGCISWYRDWRQNQLTVLTTPNQEPAQIPLTPASEPIDV